ncbi:MAG: division/cell wall cluster transcriptional repressor MraZ [Zetaproteobacteria bacterium CG12_big_fil_rev_8_21_14_0_65_55_1124]|nr:MAG: division/cell wall cluster transcriptional repressor MraZ [Zetaproteobacteria bacterium CG1_02_55_237]PIS18700.1 MAG: division/cell wall cluster transcriptional repressor MraZ [Zetaproteobacteria bacterium CG08_land_8_20_14_0_20_55_17]PIW43675.1 MAG: division/cell wall cluster transcriptional repressor MraZ [Zetaproteobacteria bacterium CG12_big_fil_rev_8_21_14_0_65_55_1124]PIY52656.1 MAG: division/cell wall cluster transcriptional repressor MraZ [Zetaproteobacteria bacterium CG_4_10_14_
MFQGEYKNTMDAKGRVNIPASFRDTLRNRYGSEEVIITRDYDGCLHAYPPKEWERDVLATVRNLPVNDQWRRSYERFVVSPAVSCQPDRQGRILLPPTLREYAGLDKTVLFAGGAGHFEIWDVTRRDTQLEQDLAMLRNGPPQF